MVFPSAACQTCKLRRIKCDQTKPVCLRCSKARRICLEAGGVDFMIHTENSYASGETKRPRGPRSSLTVIRPHFDLSTRALNYYLQTHLQAVGDVPNLTKGLAECIVAWKVSQRSCDMVDLAVSSLALAVFSQTQQNPKAAAEASARYNGLLRVVRQRVTQLGTSTLDERNIDACLLAISLMGRYEGTIYRTNGAISTDSIISRQIWSHHDGATAILKIWLDDPNHVPPSMIIKQTRRGLLRSYLLRALPIPGWMVDGLLFGEEGLEEDHDQIFVRTVNLHHRSIILQHQGAAQTPEISELSCELRELDEKLQAWAENIPVECSPQSHDLVVPGPFPRQHFYSNVVYSYPRPGYSGAWSHLYSVRMLINSTRLRLLNLPQASVLDKHFDEERLKCGASLQVVSDDLAFSIPFCLERFRVDKPGAPANPPSISFNDDNIRPYLATFAVWPLTVASCIEGIDVNQQRWFRSELASLGKVTGDSVLEAAATDAWSLR